jgi:hypothetical protein
MHTKSLNIPNIKDTFIFNRLMKLRTFFIGSLNKIIEYKKKDLYAGGSVSFFSQERQLKKINLIVKKGKKICIAAPLHLIIIKLSRRGYYHTIKHYPIANIQLLHYEDSRIISIFSNIM